MSKIKPIQIQAKRLANLRDLVGARHIIKVTAGPTHDPIVLSSGKSPDYRRQTADGTSFAGRFSACGRSCCLFLTTEDALFVVEA